MEETVKSAEEYKGEKEKIFEDERSIVKDLIKKGEPIPKKYRVDLWDPDSNKEKGDKRNYCFIREDWILLPQSNLKWKNKWRNWASISTFHSALGNAATAISIR